MELPGAARDTADAIERRVIDGLARLSAGERLARTMALCRAATELAMAGIRQREGALSDDEVRVRLARLRYGAALVDRVLAYRTKLRERALAEASPA